MDHVTPRPRLYSRGKRFGSDAIFHQDWWWWDDSSTLVFGFIPVGLAFHAGISLTAGILWALALHFCWPKGVDEIEDTTDSSSLNGGTDA